MEQFLLPFWLFYVILFMFIALFGVVGWLVFLIWQEKSKDTIIEIDEQNRFQIIKTDVKEEKYKHLGKMYFLKEGLMSKKGKKLFVISRNKPTPLKLSYNKGEWLDSESLMASINNEIIKLMVRPSNPIIDTLLMFGAVGGILAGLVGILNLLKAFGIV